jgi:hypothetical protein
MACEGESATPGSEEFQLTDAPYRPVVGSVRLPRTSSGSTTLSAAAAASALPWSSRSSSTVAVKALVSEAVPWLTVAVSVTSTSPEPASGRVTLPLSLITSGALDCQVMVDPLVPLVGRVRSVVTAERSPRSSAAMSAATRSALENDASARVVTSVAESARL